MEQSPSADAAVAADQQEMLWETWVPGFRLLRRASQCLGKEVGAVRRGPLEEWRQRSCLDPMVEEAPLEEQVLQIEPCPVAGHSSAAAASV